MATVQDYLDLLPVQNSDKPKFVALLTAFLEGFVRDNNGALSLLEKFDIDNAVGQQLDFVGQWVGLSRRLRVAINNVYFSFDDPDLGFDAGVWLGPFDDPNELVYLDDETYRQMLYIKIAANQWDGSLENAQAILRQIFEGTGSFVFIQDNFDMTMTVGISGSLPSPLFLALLTSGYFDIKPAAVAINYIVVPSEGGNPLFGFDNDNEYISGFDTGVWGTLLVPTNP